MKSTQEQIKEIFKTHFPQYVAQMNFIGELGCNEGMCKKFNNDGELTYQYLPVPIPRLPAEFIFICKEPSTPWAKDPSDAFDKVINGQYMNFTSGEFKNNKLDIMILAFRKVFGDKSILITDMSKCAINTNDADQFGLKEGLKHRYKCCAPFLRWEVTNLVANRPHTFIVGKNYFFSEYYRYNSKQRIENDITSFSRFLIEEVELNITEDIIYALPHYSIRFSCPEYILRLFKLNKAEMMKIKEEIIDNLPELYKYYQMNFTFTEKTKDTIDNNIKKLNEHNVEPKLSDSLILLYLLYENEFEIARVQWGHKKK